MIICPNCKEEIDDNSNYCDQCGHALVYCSNCSRVGMGRRCTYCGGLMTSVSDNNNTRCVSISDNSYNNILSGIETTGSRLSISLSNVSASIPVLILVNKSLDIHITGINGGIIGRKQGPYKNTFEKNPYVSGVHAQLSYNNQTGWCIIDKHSSNGTLLNQRRLHPDEMMSLKNGDIVTIANINLEVCINKS